MDAAGEKQDGATSTPARPILKLRVNSSTLSSLGKSSARDTAMATPMAEPMSSASAQKIKLKLKTSQPPTPANEINPPVFAPPPPPAPPAASATPAKIKTKSGRVTKPSAKKRAKDDAASDGETPLPSQVKRIKIHKTPTTPASQKAVKLKLKSGSRQPPHHPPGDGYDSELEDREVDPVIEEQFILRYEGGVEEDLEYLTQMVEQGRIGAPAGGHVKEGKAPAQFDIKWLSAERRAVVRIRGNLYAAVLLDLPTITESMKTWDKKNLMKTADICQMLLIFAKIGSEQEARTAPLPPPTSETDHRWPHGLTPPMHDAVQRRFRKRLTKKEVKDKEAELNRLLEADRLAANVRWEIVNIGNDGKEQFGDYPDEDQDAEGDEDDELDGGGGGTQPNGGVLPSDDADGLFDDDDDLVNELEGMLDEQEEEAGPAQDGATPLQTTGGGGGGDAITPAAQTDGRSDTAGEDDDNDDDDDDDDDGEDVDEDAEGEAAEKDDTNEAIAEAQRQVAKLEADLAVTTNRLLRTRVETQLKHARKHLAGLMAKLNAGDEDEDEEG